MAKATKLDKEIQEGLYDPKAVIRQITAKEWNTKKKHGYTLVKNGQKYILRINKGKTILEPIKVYDPKRERTYIAWNIKEQKPVGWLGTAKDRNEMEDRLKKYKAPDHITSKRLYDPTTDKAKGMFKVVSNIPKNGFLLHDGTSLDLSEHADILRVNLNQNQFMKKANAMRVESYRDEYVNVEIDVHTTPSLAQWNALSKFPKIFYDFSDGMKNIIAHGIVFSVGDLKNAWMKEQKKLYDPKQQSHVYKVGWKAKTGFKVKSFWTKAEMDKQIAILKKAGIWYRAWQAGTDKVYDPKASVVPVRWYEAMVKGIKKSSDVRNPYAIVKSIWSKLSSSKKAEIKAREKKGERFKYNLPLPMDKPTRGTGTVRMVKPFKLAEVQVNLSVRDYLAARASGLFSRMKRHDGTIALVSRCKSPKSNTNIFIDKIR